MQYFKWMYELEDRVYRVPGFVFYDYNAALKYKDEFTDWMQPEIQGTPQKLFTFEGTDPTPIPIMLMSHLGGRHKVQKLSPSELKAAMQHLHNQPEDWLFIDGDVMLVAQIAETVGCIAPQVKDNYVYSEEAYYAWPETMIAVDGVFESELNTKLGLI